MANNNERVVNGVKTRVLHGKDYVEVAERINSVYKAAKELEIIESMPYEIAGRLLWRIVIKVDGKQHIGNAEVKLDAPKNTPDGTNPFECAETSAMGRALAFAGFGSVERIASYDEVMRSQPFVSVVESSQSRVVDSGAARLSAPSNITERRRSLYDRALELGQFQKGATPQESLDAFLGFVGPVIEANVTGVEQLTNSRLDVLEAYLNAQDAA
jgi:hypothetical protein